MRKLRIGVIDLVTKGPTRALYARVMYANLASIMPQVIAVWCEEEGHDVTFICYTGFENLVEESPDRVDLVFVGGFTEAGQLAYALSNLFRSRGAVTALGGPHARRQEGDLRGLAGLLAAPATRCVHRSQAATHDPSRGT